MFGGGSKHMYRLRYANSSEMQVMDAAAKGHHGSRQPQVVGGCIRCSCSL